MLLAFFSPAIASDMTSTNFKIISPIMGTGAGYGTSTNFQLISAGNTLGSMGGASSTNFKANYGFLYYQNTLSTITFDLDTAADFHNDASVAPYSVALGTLTTGSVTHSNDSSIRMIVVNGSSTAPVVVTVQNANGANGLASLSVPGDHIPSATASMAAGTANYGLCVDTGTLSGFSRSGSYSSGTCALASGTNAVKALSTTPAAILDSGGSALPSGKAEVVVNAAISPTSPAHNDYSDTLTFIETGTF